MKMNAIKFAELISFVTRVCNGNCLSSDNIKEIEYIIDEGVEQPTPINVVGLQPNEVTDYLNEVLKYCREQKKINAIQVVRKMSDMGLKEAKDWVEVMHTIGSPTKPVE